MALNADGTSTFALIDWGEAETVSMDRSRRNQAFVTIPFTCAVSKIASPEMLKARDQFALIASLVFLYARANFVIRPSWCPDLCDHQAVEVWKRRATFFQAVLRKESGEFAKLVAAAEEFAAAANPQPQCTL